MHELYKRLTTLKQQAEHDDSIHCASPRGFPYGCASSIDPAEVSAFVAAYHSPECERDAWPTKRAALELALLLFGESFGRWCRDTIRSEPYTQRHDAFLEDTLRFINTGKRQLSPDNWKALIPGWLDSERSDVLYRVKRTEFSYPIPHVMSECLSQWCAHPKGLHDMVCTLDLLFGHAREDFIEGDRNHEPSFRVKL